MEKTNNKITVTIPTSNYEEVPVMRNGKPTKRTKTIWTVVDIEVSANGYIIDGHELFITDRDFEDAMNPRYEWQTMVRLYRKDGSRLTCECQYGKYGTADHTQTVDYDMRHKRFWTSTLGYTGATTKCWGATIKRINW